eukprot:UN03934
MILYYKLVIIYFYNNPSFSLLFIYTFVRKFCNLVSLFKLPNASIIDCERLVAYSCENVEF